MGVFFIKGDEIEKVSRSKILKVFDVRLRNLYYFELMGRLVRF